MQTSLWPENIFMAETARSRRRLMGGADLIARAAEVLAPLAEIEPPASGRQAVELAAATGRNRQGTDARLSHPDP